MSDIVWAINPQRESVRDLIRRMREHAEEIFTRRDIELSFTTPVSAADLKLRMDVRRDVFLLFKEAVNNAARHSQCSKVQIDFRVDGSRLLLTVIDNGVGFDPSIEEEGQGLTSMRQRACRLNGNLRVRSSTGAGTTVALDVPR